LSERLRSSVMPEPSPTSLDDEMVKLVAYTIVSVKRDLERVMPKSGDSIIITQRMSEQAFISFVIARYLQSEAYANLAPEEKLATRDQKYLRVQWAVTRRWPQESLEFEERQIEVLAGIRDALK
jgi:hypothetical protein